MKKLLAFVLVALVGLCAPDEINLSDAVDGAGDVRYTFYVEGVRYVEGALTTLNGEDSFLTCNIEYADRVRSELDDIRGESVKLRTDADTVQRIVDELKLSIVYVSDRTSSIYGYSSRLGEGITIQGREINCQIAVSDGIVTVGYPVILGSY